MSIIAFIFGCFAFGEFCVSMMFFQHAYRAWKYGENRR